MSQKEGQTMNNDMEIKVTTYEEDRLNYFERLMRESQYRYNRLFKRFKNAPIMSAEAQRLSDAGREVQFHGDVVEMLEKGYRKQEWISVDERLPEPFVSVLVHMPGERPHPTVREGFINKRGKWYAGGFDRLPDEVVSWMEMPEAPKMKGGAE
jgi:hypothetical protein